MLPIRPDFLCRTNADFAEEFTVVDTGDAVDLTGHTPSMTVKTTVNGDTVFSLSMVTTAAQGIRVIEAESGIFAVQIDYETLSAAYDAVVANYEQGKTISLAHDIKFISPTGLHEVWFQGILAIDKGITT